MLNFDPEVSVKYDLVAIACRLRSLESISGFDRLKKQASHNFQVNLITLSL